MKTTDLTEYLNDRIKNLREEMENILSEVYKEHYKNDNNYDSLSDFINKRTTEHQNDIDFECKKIIIEDAHDERLNRKLCELELLCKKIGEERRSLHWIKVWIENQKEITTTKNIAKENFLKSLEKSLDDAKSKLMKNFLDKKEIDELVDDFVGSKDLNNV